MTATVPHRMIPATARVAIVVAPMRRGESSRAQRARSVIGAMFAALIVMNLALSLASENFTAIRDPVYSDRLAKLRAHWHGSTKPKVLVIGSSRVWFGFDALKAEEYLPEYSFFNFGLPAAGPITQRLILERLLSDGVVPDRVVFEIMPPLMMPTGTGPEEHRYLRGERLTRSELAMLGKPQPQVREWRQARCLPFVGLRNQLLSRVAANALPWPSRHDAGRGVDAGGRVHPAIRSVSGRERAAGLAREHRIYAERLAGFQWDDTSLKTVWHLREFCSTRAIGTAVILMPESSEFRSWYQAAFQSDSPRLIESVGDCIDARFWLRDDHFADGHHVIDAGAETLTSRLCSVLRSRWDP